MEFILDGKIWQWDEGLLLTVDMTGMLPDPDGHYYAHFVKVGSSKVEAVEISGGKAAIPNDMVQSPGGLIVYGYRTDDESGRTLVAEQFQVLSRPKPPEYIYEPTPVITYPELVDLVNDLEGLKSILKNVSAEAATLRPGEPATAEAEETENGLHFSFGIPGADDVFEAVYGETSVEDVLAAWSAGKVVFCRYRAADNNVYFLVSANDGTVKQAFFQTSTAQGYIRQLQVGSSGWSDIGLRGRWSKELLWQNQDPTATFDAQTVSFFRSITQGIGNIMILFRINGGTGTDICKTMIIPTEFFNNSERRYVIEDDYSVFSASSHRRGRRIYGLTENSMTFDKGYMDGSVQNGALIPMKIFWIP